MTSSAALRSTDAETPMRATAAGRDDRLGVASGLVAANERLAKFQTGFERDFEALAAGLFALSNSARGLDERLGQVSFSVGGGDGGPAVRALSRLRVEFALRLEQLAGLRRALMAEGKSVEGVVGDMAESLQNIERLTARLRFAGMNAIIAASRSGQSGTAFSLLARELTSLIQAQLPLAQRLSGAAARLRRQIGELVALRADAVAAQSGRTELGYSGDDAIAGLIATTREIGQWDGIATLRARVAQFQDVVGQAVLGLQCQDIVRQKIDHVRTLVDASLLEMRGNLSTSPRARTPAGALGLAAFAFVEKAVSLAAELLRETVGDLGVLCSDTDAAVAATAEGLADVGRIRTEIVHQFETRLRTSAAAIDELEAPLKAQDARAQEYQGAIQSIVASIKGVRGDFAALNAVLGQLRTLRTLMRIEISTNRSLASEIGVLAEIDGVAAAMTSFLGTNEAALDVMAAIFHKLSAASAVMTSSRARLTGLTANSRQHGAEILRAGAEVLSIFDGAVSITEQMDAETARLSGALRELVVNVAQLTAVAGALEAQAQGGGGGENGGTLADLEAARRVAQDKLSALTQRFTVLAHKKLGARATGSDAGDGDAGGTLTFF